MHGVLCDPCVPREARAGPPRLSNSMAVGLTDLIGKVSDKPGLTKVLANVFEEKDTKPILNLASYGSIECCRRLQNKL